MIHVSFKFRHVSRRKFCNFRIIKVDDVIATDDWYEINEILAMLSLKLTGSYGKCLRIPEVH